MLTAVIGQWSFVIGNGNGNGNGKAMIASGPPGHRLAGSSSEGWTRIIIPIPIAIPTPTPISKSFATLHRRNH